MQPTHLTTKAGSTSSIGETQPRKSPSETPTPMKTGKRISTSTSLAPIHWPKTTQDPLKFFQMAVSLCFLNTLPALDTKDS